MYSICNIIYKYGVLYVISTSEVFVSSSASFESELDTWKFKLSTFCGISGFLCEAARANYPIDSYCIYFGTCLGIQFKKLFYLVFHLHNQYTHDLFTNKKRFGSKFNMNTTDIYI